MTDDLKARLRSFDPHTHELEVVDEAADRIEALELALTQSRAETAAVIEWAAQKVFADQWPNYGDAKRVSENIRALATPDQTAALDAIRAEAQEQGMRDAENRMKAAIEASGKLGRIIGFLGENEELIAAFREACGPELIARFHAATKGAKA